MLRSQALGLGLLLSGRVPRLDAGECPLIIIIITPQPFWFKSVGTEALPLNLRGFGPDPQRGPTMGKSQRKIWQRVEVRGEREEREREREGQRERER